MTHRLTLTGKVAVVQWGYAAAASIGPWAITVLPDGGTLTATVVSADSFKVSQQPLTFVVARPSGQVWRWPITLLQIAGESLTATLGPPVETSYGPVRYAAHDSP